MKRALLLFVVAVAACGRTSPVNAPPDPAVTSVKEKAADAIPLPGGDKGIGFDDLVFAPSLRKVLAPAAGTGNLDLVDPATRAVTPIGGFSAVPYGGGHDASVTSADEGNGLIYAVDRTAKQLDVVDSAKGAIVANVKLAADPDYVRWVEPTREIWVTEPDGEQIEVFSAAPAHTAVIAVKGGPESLVVDPARKRAYAHTWKGSTVAIDLASRAIVATWPNGCEGSRGIALDAPRGLLFVGCAEGKVTALDVAHDGKKVGEAKTGAGVDVIAYAPPPIGHVYAPGGKSATLTIVGVGQGGELTALATAPTAQGAHCVAVDDRGTAYVCDPAKGRLIVVKDEKK